ncbi:MAG TPA: hypothetical protein VH593_18275 [Ktedonobacteraceae bacterium]
MTNCDDSPGFALLRGDSMLAEARCVRLSQHTISSERVMGGSGDAHYLSRAIR